MSQTTNDQMVFTGRGPTVKFANYEEFFETLGILCRGDYSTVIKGRTNTDSLHLPPGTQPAQDGYAAGMKVLEEGNSLPYAQDSYYIECLHTIYYTKAFYDIFQERKGSRISCSSFVRYLLDEGYAEKIVKPGEDVISVKASDPDDVRSKMKQKGFEKFLYFFEKGLAAPSIVSK